MADLVLSNTKVFLGAYDITGQTNGVSLIAATELLDATDFESAGWRERVAGLKTIALQVEGKTDASTLDAALLAGLGVADVPVSVIPVPTVGQVAYFFKCVQGDYSPVDGAVGELARFSAGAEASSGKLIRGSLMINGAALSASGNGTALQLGAVGATQSIYAALHVFSVSASDTLDVIIQSDNAEAMSTPITRLTFPQATAIGSGFVSAAGAITDDWWRVSYTLGGAAIAISFAVVLGIGPTL